MFAFRGSLVLPAHPSLQRAGVFSNAVSGSEVPGVKASSSIPARTSGLQLLTKNGGMRFGRCISSTVSADNKCDSTPRVVDVLPMCADVANHPDLGNLGQQTPHLSTVSRQYSCINNIYVAPHFAPVSSTVSRQVSAIFSRQRAPVIYPTLNTKAVPFCPRVTHSVASTAAAPEPPTPTLVTLQSPDTLILPMLSQLMPHLSAEPVPPDILNPPQLCGMSTPSEPASTDVPSHLQELFGSTLDQCSLSLANQQRLAAVLRRNSDTFAKNSMDIGYCSVLEHDIDTGDANHIKQPPRRPPISAKIGRAHV